MSKAVEDVIAERIRQVEAEGWTPEHDDDHDRGEMALAAAVYARGATLDDPDRYVMDEFGLTGTPGNLLIAWPWAKSWWKPHSRRRDLVKAAALIVAEIERLDRKAATGPMTMREAGIA